MKEKIRQELESLFTEEFVNALHIVSKTTDNEKTRINIQLKESKPEVHLRVNLGENTFFVCINGGQRTYQVLSFDYDITKDTFSNNLFHLTDEIEKEINFLLLREMEVTKQNKTLSMSDFISVFDKLK